MSFNVSLLIRADSSQARQEVAGLAAALPRLGQGGAQAAQGARTLTEATAALERSARSTTAATALFPPTAQAMSRSAVQAAQAAGRLPVPLRQSARGMQDLARAATVLPGPLGAVTGRISAMVASVGMIGPAAAGGAIAAIALAGTVSRGIRAFAEYERQMLTTEQVIRATGGAAGRTADDIDRLARDIGRGTLASTTAVREAAAQVLTFRSITGETFDRTLRLAQDLSAVGFGSISQSAVQLAKALEDPEQGLAALRRVGVSFSASQVEMIRNFTETGRVAEAQNLILAQVEKQVGGAGIAAGSGLSGAFDALTEETGRWFELVGSRVSEMIGLRDALLGVAGGIATVNEALDPSPQAMEAQIRARMRANLAARTALESEIAGGRQPDPSLYLGNADLRTTQARRELEAINAQIEADQRKLVDFALRAHREIEASWTRSQQEQAAMARDRIDGVIAGLQREIEMLGQTELARAQIAAAQKAGVDLATAEGQQIAAMVEQTFRLQKAREATSLLAELQQEAQIREAIARYGEDSVEVARLRKEAEREVFEQTLATLNVSEEMKAELTRAWEAARGLAGTNMAGGIAAARAEARGMADEILRALGAAQSLASQGISSLRESELRLQYADDPVGLAGNLARERMRAAQGVRRDGAEGGELAALDAEVEAYARNMAAIERNNQARQALNQTRAAGGGAAQVETSAIGQLIETLQAELAILAATDPVQRELLRHREALASATDTERQMVEELIAARQREEAAASAIAARADLYGNMVGQVLDGLIVKGQSADEVLKGLIRTLLQATIQAAIFGTGPFGGLFGGVGIFGGPARMATGGEVRGPGTGTSDSVPILASNGEYVVNARAAQANLPLLEAINTGGLPRFARGGMVGGGAGAGTAAAASAAAPQFNIDVRGARGNREIEEAVARGVEAGLKQYDAYVLPRSFARIDADRRRVG